MADKLDINEVLAHIDNIDMGYFDALSDEDKKLFQPYVILRWMTSLNDSVVLKYKSSLFESVTGKWKEGGKDTCKQIVDAVNNLTGYTVCTGVNKTGDQNTRSWYIVFSVTNQQSAAIVETHIKSLTGQSPYLVVSDLDSETYKSSILATNEYVNVGFWDTNKHPALQYKLMCVAGAYTAGVNKPRNWLAMIGGDKSNINTVLEFFKKFYDDPCMRPEEAKLIIAQLSRDEFVQMIESSGLVSSSDYKRFITAYEREKHL